METTKSFEAPEAKLHFLDYWRIIRVRKTVILAVFLLVAITTALVTFILPPTYASFVRISVQKDATDIPGLQGSGPVYAGFDPYWVQTEFEKIQSKSILYQVINKLDLNRKWGEKFKEPELRTDITYKLLKKAVDVTQSRNTTLIEIKVFSDDATEASDIANKIAEVYRESRLATWQERASKGLLALQSELANHTEAITNLQREVDDLKERFGISDVEAQQGLTSPPLEPETLRKLQAARIEQQAEFARLEATYSQLSNCSRAELKRTMQTAAFDALLQRLLEELSLNETKLASLTNSFSWSHPEVKGVRDVIAVLNAQVDERLTGILAGLRITKEAKKALLDTLVTQEDVAKTNDITMAILRRPYYQKKRDLESMQYIRERLTSRIWQEKVDNAMPKSGIVEITDKAEPDLRPVKPNKFLNIALGVVVGLAIGIGLAFFIEYLDTSVKTIDDVERALQSPV
ncbi:MAG TPA: Wzz/FepE/Etk N-terminal domain-containing protein, partial [Candidatus Binatia bacterium]|nr:Wzz/FepE/Etk N-terminal domain-containing protein [Candidatus Binatia bacterium]